MGSGGAATSSCPYSTRSRKIRNQLATVWMVGALLVALIPLAFVLTYVVMKGSQALSWAWFTEDLPAVTRRAGGGMGPAIVGRFDRRAQGA